MVLFEEGFWNYVSRPLFTSLWLLAFAAFLLQVWVFIFALRLRRHMRLSNIFYLNIFLWLFYSFSVFIWQCYIFSFMDSMKRDVYALFFIGIVMTGAGHALSLSISMLMLERIIIIAQPAFHARRGNLLVIFAFTVCVGVFIFIPANSCIRELPLDPLTECQTFFCIMKNGTAYLNSTLKTVIGGVNLFLTLVFGVIMFAYMKKGNGGSTNKRYRMATLIVVFAAISEVSFVIAPKAFELTCQVTKWSVCSLSYMGYAVQLNTLFTAIVYLLILRPKGKIQAGQVTTLSSSFGKK